MKIFITKILFTRKSYFYKIFALWKFDNIWYLLTWAVESVDETATMNFYCLNVLKYKKGLLGSLIFNILAQYMQFCSKVYFMKWS